MWYVYNVKCKYIKVLISLLYPANRKTIGIQNGEDNNNFFFLKSSSIKENLLTLVTKAYLNHQSSACDVVLLFEWMSMSTAEAAKAKA